jgi:hypothetical protein
MDTKALVKKLHDIFQGNNNGINKYSKVWLSHLNYGGLYYSKDFELKLKTEYKIDRYLKEIEEVSSLLQEKAREESKYILRISVYGSDEQAEPENDDYLVHEEEEVLP